jgi:hypothetical protein
MPSMPDFYVVVVSTPILHFRTRVVKAQKPVCIQTLEPEFAIEGFDEAVVGRLAGREKSNVAPR